MNIRDSLSIDIKAEIETVNFKNLTEIEKSYNYILETIELTFKDKKRKDKSLTYTDILYIKYILDNEEKYTLLDSYYEILDFLENYKCKMDYKKRKTYFQKRLNKDCGVYLLETIDKIVNLTNDSHYNICCNLGMTNSEALDFLDAYNHEDGWLEEINN